MTVGGIATFSASCSSRRKSKELKSQERKTKREGMVLVFSNHPSTALKSDLSLWVKCFSVFLFSGFPDIKCRVSCLVLYFLKQNKKKISSKVAHSVHKESSLFPTILPLTLRSQTSCVVRSDISTSYRQQGAETLRGCCCCSGWTDCRESWVGQLAPVNHNTFLVVFFPFR